MQTAVKMSEHLVTLVAAKREGGRRKENRKINWYTRNRHAPSTQHTHTRGVCTALRWSPFNLPFNLPSLHQLSLSSMTVNCVVVVTVRWSVPQSVSNCHSAEEQGERDGIECRSLTQCCEQCACLSACHPLRVPCVCLWVYSSLVF